METARKWLKAWEAQGEPPGRALALAGSGMECLPEPFAGSTVASSPVVWGGLLLAGGKMVPSARKTRSPGLLPDRCGALRSTDRVF